MTSVEQILTSVLRSQAGTTSLPRALCERCAEALPVTGVGLALMSDRGHEGVVAATDGLARVMEDLQVTLGEGPCTDASAQGRPVLQPDLAATAAARWPAFGPAVLDAGIAAIFAIPLQVGGIRLGVLDLYRDTAGNLDDRQLSDAFAYADAAKVVLMHLQDQMEPGEGLHPQLADTLGNRPELHQATGMISVQAAVGLTEAFLLLRARAFAIERPLLDLARDVVARRFRFDTEDGADG